MAADPIPNAPSLNPDPSAAKGTVYIVGTDKRLHSLSAGTDTYVLTAKASATNGIDWEAPSTGASPGGSTGNLQVNGGSGTLAGLSGSSFSGTADLTLGGNLTQSSAAGTTITLNTAASGSYSAFNFQEGGVNRAFFEFVNSAFSDATRRNAFEIINETSDGPISLWTDARLHWQLDSSGNVNQFGDLLLNGHNLNTDDGSGTGGGNLSTGGGSITAGAGMFAVGDQFNKTAQIVLSNAATSGSVGIFSANARVVIGDLDLESDNNQKGLLIIGSTSGCHIYASPAFGAVVDGYAVGPLTLGYASTYTSVLGRLRINGPTDDGATPLQVEGDVKASGAGTFASLAGDGSALTGLPVPTIASVLGSGNDASGASLTNVGGFTFAPSVGSLDLTGNNIFNVGTLTTAVLAGSTLAVSGALADGTYTCGVGGSITIANGVITAIS